MWLIVLLILSIIGITLSRFNVTFNVEDADASTVVITLLGILVTVPIAFFSFGFIAWYLVTVLFAYSGFTFWQIAWGIFFVRILLSRKVD